MLVGWDPSFQSIHVFLKKMKAWLKVSRSFLAHRLLKGPSETFPSVLSFKAISSSTKFCIIHKFDKYSLASLIQVFNNNAEEH